MEVQSVNIEHCLLLLACFCYGMFAFFCSYYNLKLGGEA